MRQLQQLDVAEAIVRQTLAALRSSPLLSTASNQGDPQGLRGPQQLTTRIFTPGTLQRWEAASSAGLSELQTPATGLLTADHGKSNKEPRQDGRTATLQQPPVPAEMTPIDASPAEMTLIHASDRQKLIAHMQSKGKTTVMIRDLPTALRQSDLLRMLDTIGFRCKYDFAYMPSCLQTSTGKGYGFINFMELEAVAAFIEVCWGSRYFCTASHAKPISVCAANVQGAEANTKMCLLGKTRRVRNPALQHSCPRVSRGIPQPLAADVCSQSLAPAVARVPCGNI
eukprot:TRINITY_DN48068_c0_g1_i1.p1 TRINITY_DN48068_c0_g1~~TRINITY_DN48068_c0_g1_i1.p1  ORF type:complete len:283 (+),score=40.97 TRINITY_DN48068_c0_g1_i1:1-849(+)